MRKVAGVDLGGTKIAVGLVDETGSLLTRAECATPSAQGPRAVLETVIGLIRTVIGSEGDALAVGVGAAGVIDSATGMVLSATETIAGWAGTDLATEVSGALSLPVVAMNDVHAHAIGEAWTGAARDKRSLLMVAAGTGIGGALVLDGAVWPGAHFAAGHLGHIPCPEADGVRCTCGGVGHLEAIASGPAIRSEFTRRGGTASDGKAISELAAGGHPLARQVVETAGAALGRAIGGLVNTLDPDLVVIGGGLASGGPLWWSALGAGVSGELLPLLSGCPVLPAELGADAAIIGSSWAAFRSIGAAE